MNTFAERIKYLRKNVLNMTQIDFGKIIGVAGTTVTGWEKRGLNPSEAAVKMICKEFNVNPLWLKDGIGDMINEFHDELFEEMTINERLLYLRKTILKISQSELGKVCGVNHTAISKMEKNGSTITERNIELICKEFNVNALWLKQGIGEILGEPKKDLITKLFEIYNLNPKDKQFISDYLELNQESRNLITTFINKTFFDK